MWSVKWRKWLASVAVFLKSFFSETSVFEMGSEIDELF